MSSQSCACDMAQFEKHKADLVQQLTSLQRQHTDTLTSEASTQHSLTAQLDTLRTAHDAMRREYEQQHVDVRHAKHEAATMREEMMHKVAEYGEMEREYGILQAKHRAVMEKEDSAR